jgi:hypothetical protein
MKYLVTFELFEAKRAPNQLKRAILDFIAKNPKSTESEIKKGLVENGDLEDMTTSSESKMFGENLRKMFDIEIIRSQEKRGNRLVYVYDLHHDKRGLKMKRFGV